jgi:hypothetical protein
MQQELTDVASQDYWEAQPSTRGYSKPSEFVIESRTKSTLKTIQAGAQKKRRVDGALGLRAAGDAVSKGLQPTKQGLNIPDLLPIQHDSWSEWNYCE